MDGYSLKVEQQMARLYQSLRERDRRRYAAVEVENLGHGGLEYIAKLFGSDPKTIRHGRVGSSWEMFGTLRLVVSVL